MPPSTVLALVQPLHHPSPRPRPVGLPPTDRRWDGPRDASGFVVRHLATILDRLDCLCRRQSLSMEDREDFPSWAILRLLEKGPSLEEQYRGKSSVSTYLDSILVNLLHDYRIARWGKWRASAMARQLGGLARDLERLLYRERMPVEEAVAVLTERVLPWRRSTREQVREELWELAARLPVRVDRRDLVDSDVLARHPDTAAERDFETRRATRRLKRLEQALAGALVHLGPRPRRVLRLRYERGLTFAQIADSTGISTQSLYGMVARSMKKLRRLLEEEGVCVHDVLEALEVSGSFCLERLFEGAERRVDRGIG